MANEQNLIPAKKGEIRNPKGKPKGVPHTKTRLKRLLQITQNLTNPITGEMEGFSVAEQLDLAQIVKALGGDTNAYNTIVDRLEGKATQAVDLNVGNDPRKEILAKYGLGDGDVRETSDTKE